MRVLILLLVAILLQATACQKRTEAPPPLSREQMVSLMMEIYLSEARTSLLPLDKDSSYRLFMAHQDSLLQRHGLQDSTLRKAYAYYLEHPTELESIYDAIIDSLSLREQRLRGAQQGH